MAVSERLPPSADDLVAIGEAILAMFPPEIRALVGNMPVRVQDWPDEATLAAMEVEDPLDLTGLFQGIPLGEREGGLPSADPEMIYLFRMPILFEWCERGVALEEVVFDVLTHEIGHFFGMDEARVLTMEGRSDELS
jgi:predicted Zn-dependent protease with MMP-like domain